MENQNDLKRTQLQSVLDYVVNDKSCKSRQLLEYFGETESKNCGICSYCITKNKTEKKVAPIAEKIVELLKKSPMSSREIQMYSKFSDDAIIFALKQLLEINKIEILPNNKYTLK